MRSFIIAVDNNVSLMSNFIGYLQPELEQDDEVIFVSDGCDRLSTKNYLNQIASTDQQFVLIEKEGKGGFSYANNLGVSLAQSDTLIFINTDAFLAPGCVKQLTQMLWSAPDIAAVQPLLIYPQTELVQSTGHVFSSVKSGHLFAGRNRTDRIVQQSAPRQALTMAVCAVKKDLFLQIGGFDEIYYNSHEGMELTLKLSLHGYRCMYCASAVAYHCSYTARSQIVFDVSRQRALFYQRWGNVISPDLEYYLRTQMSRSIESRSYIVYNMSSSMDWQILLEHLGISYTRSFILEERFSTQINLYNCISFTNMHYPVPFLFICDSLSQIRGNRNWIRNRSNPDDIVIDLNGNLINLQSLI